MCRDLQRDRSARRGATTVELALVLGLCFTFFMGIFEYGRLMMVRNILDNAGPRRSEAGGGRHRFRAGVTGTNGDGTLTQAEILAHINLMLAQQAPTAVSQVYATDSNGNQINGVAWNSGVFATGIGVKISYTYTPMVPTFGVLPSMTITSKAVMQSEANN